MDDESSFGVITRTLFGKNTLLVFEKRSVAKSFISWLGKQDFVQVNNHDKKKDEQIPMGVKKWTHAAVLTIQAMFGKKESRGKLFLVATQGNFKSTDWKNKDNKTNPFSRIMERKTADGCGKLVEYIQRKSREVSQVIALFDNDIAGESMSADVHDVCIGINPKLEFHRAYTSNCYGNFGKALSAWYPLNPLFVEAAHLREEVDRRISVAFCNTHGLFEDALREEFGWIVKLPTFSLTQIPLLGIIVEREIAVENMKKKMMTEVIARDNGKNNNLKFKLEPGPLEKHEADKFVDSRGGKIRKCIVRKFVDGCGTIDPPAPLTTAELIYRAYLCHKIEAEETMKYAEELYLDGFISYPRTDASCYSINTPLKLILKEAKGGNWPTYANQLLQRHTFNIYRIGMTEFHSAIHPAKIINPEDIKDKSSSNQKRKLYELVVQHFLASLSNPILIDEFKVVIDCGYVEPHFVASGWCIPDNTEANFFQVYSFEKSNLERVQSMSTSSVVDSYKNSYVKRTELEVSLEPETVSALSLYNVGELISDMAKLGIGTPSTYSSTITNLMNNGCIEKTPTDGYRSTKIGRALYNTYVAIGYERLLKPYFRIILQHLMWDVRKGRQENTTVLKVVLNEFEDNLKIINTRMQDKLILHTFQGEMSRKST